jgi:hypothetical protein
MDNNTHRHQLMNAAHAMRRELLRYDIPLRPLILAEVILSISFGWGRRTVRVPKLEIFTDLTGIARGHVHEALKKLHQMRILTVSVASGVPEYELLPDSEKWQCCPRVTRASIAEAIRMLKALNNIDLTMPTPISNHDQPAASADGESKNFPSVLDANFFADSVPPSVTNVPVMDEFPALS